MNCTVFSNICTGVGRSAALVAPTTLCLCGVLEHGGVCDCLDPIKSNTFGILRVLPPGNIGVSENVFPC